MLTYKVEPDCNGCNDDDHSDDREDHGVPGEGLRCCHRVDGASRDHQDISLHMREGRGEMKHL